MDTDDGPPPNSTGSPTLVRCKYSASESFLPRCTLPASCESSLPTSWIRTLSQLVNACLALGRLLQGLLRVVSHHQAKACH